MYQGKHGIRIDDGRSESTENFAAKDPGSLKIWQRNEFSVNDNDANEMPWDDAEMQSIRRGRLGTKSTVVGNSIQDEHVKGSENV
jgi:hypothetical protein